MRTIELSHEGCEIDGFEGTREDVLGHELGIWDNERGASFVPPHIVVRLGVVDQSGSQVSTAKREAVRMEFVEEGRDS
jgi:hypothetical protein